MKRHLILFSLLISVYCVAGQSVAPRSWISGLEFSPEEKLIHASFYDSSIRTWAVQTSDVTNTYRTGALVMTSKLSPDGKLLLAHLETGEMEIWDLVTGTRRATTMISKTVNFQSYFVKNGAWIITAASDFNTRDLVVTAWDSKTGQRADGQRTYGIVDYAFTPSGEKYISLTSSGFLFAWDALTMKPLNQIKMEDSVSQIAISADGNSFSTFSPASGLTIYDMQSGEVKNKWILPETDLKRMEYTPDGKQMITIARNGNAAIWNLASGKKVVDLGNFGMQDYGWMARPTFNKKGDLLAINYDKNKIDLWNLKKGKRLHLLQDKTFTLMPVFTQNSRKLLVSNGYEGASIWDVKTGKKWRSYTKLVK